MKRLLLASAILASMILTACGVSRSAAPQTTANRSYSLPAMGGAAPAPAAQPNMDLLNSPDAAVQKASAESSGNTASAADRLVVKTAELTVVVKDVNASASTYQSMADQLGGSIVSLNIYQVSDSNGTQVPQADLVVRVPQEKLDNAIAQIKQNTVEVKNETRTGLDVTDQYVDLQSRLTAKQAAQDQLLKIMQNANRTQDVLDVYQQLQQIESDIEVLKGQIKYYEQSAALSAITVHILAQESVQPIQVGGWQPQGVARDAVQNLIFFWQGFISFMITLVLYILPVLITIGIPLFLLFLLVRSLVRFFRKQRSKTVQPQAAGD